MPSAGPSRRCCASRRLLAPAREGAARQEARVRSRTDLHFLAVDVHGAHGEVDADGILLLLVVLPRLEAVHHARLPHVGVADQDDLEEVVEGIVRARAGEGHRGCRAGLRPGREGGGAAGPGKEPRPRRSLAGAALPGQVTPLCSALPRGRREL